MGPRSDDPSWRHRQRHKIGVCQIFAEYPPPCTSMSCSCPRASASKDVNAAAAGHTRLPWLRSDNWVLADCLARSTNVDAKPATSSASASHGAQIVGLVTL
jgi:hypothetical protein